MNNDNNNIQLQGVSVQQDTKMDNGEKAKAYNLYAKIITSKNPTKNIPVGGGGTEKNMHTRYHRWKELRSPNKVEVNYDTMI